MDEPRALIEVVTPADIRSLTKAPHQQAAFNIFQKIVLRLPEPRAYLCESFWLHIHKRRWLWEEGRQTLSVGVVNAGMNIIDPDSVRSIAGYSKYLKIDRPNPFILRLFKLGHLQAIYVPDDRRRTIERDELCNLATELEVPLLFWKPKFVRQEPRITFRR